MKTIFLAKETEDIPYDVCHIYEHWLFMSFRAHLEKELKVSSGLTGLLAAETYKYLIFVECYFYHDKVTKLFNDFIVSRQLNHELLDVCIKQCAAEERVAISISDQSQFNKYIDRLKKLPWEDGNKMAAYVYLDDRPKQDQPLEIKKSAKSYKTIGIELGLNNADLEEQALFLRLYVLIQDLACVYLQGKGWYVQDDVGIRHEGDKMFTALSLNVPKSDATNREIEQGLEQFLNNIDVHAAMPYLAAHFKEFKDNPFLQGQPRNVLHYSPVVAGNEIVAELATEARIKKVLTSIKVAAFNMTFAEAKDLTY